MRTERGESRGPVRCAVARVAAERASARTLWGEVRRSGSPPPPPHSIREQRRTVCVRWAREGIRSISHSSVIRVELSKVM